MVVRRQLTETYMMLSTIEYRRSRNRPILTPAAGRADSSPDLQPGTPIALCSGSTLTSKLADEAAAKSARPVCAGSVNALPFPDGVFA